MAYVKPALFHAFPLLQQCPVTETRYSYGRNASTELRSTIFVNYCRADQKLYAFLYDFVFKTNLIKVTSVLSQVKIIK